MMQRGLHLIWSFVLKCFTKVHISPSNTKRLYQWIMLWVTWKIFFKAMSINKFVCWWINKAVLKCMLFTIFICLSGGTRSLHLKTWSRFSPSFTCKYIHNNHRMLRRGTSTKEATATSDVFELSQTGLKQIYWICLTP